MDFFDFLLYLIPFPFESSNKPEIEARLLPRALQIGNKLNIEIESIGENYLHLESMATLHFNDKTNESLPLDLVGEELILAPFTPIKVSFPISNRKEINKIEFQLKYHGVIKVKLTKNHEYANLI